MNKENRIAKFYLVLTILFLLILFYPIDAEFIYHKGITVKIRFSLLALTIKNFKSRKKISLNKGIKLISAIKAAIIYLIRHSKIHLTSLYVPESQSYPKTALLSHGAIMAFLPIIVSYFNIHSSEFTSSDNAMLTIKPGDDMYVEFNLKISLIHTLISFFIMIFTYLKKENLSLGKQNE